MFQEYINILQLIIGLKDKRKIGDPFRAIIGHLLERKSQNFGKP